MAEVNTGGGDKQKGKQKKVSLRVDFTPMVDMNMLLITFFMFCTSLSKPQTMEINMPSKDKVVETDQNEVKESNAVTIILSGNDKVYYYTGIPKQDDSNALVESSYADDGLRDFLLSRNAEVHRKMQELKVRKLNKELSETDFKKQSIEIKKNKTAPVVMIKATDKATYNNLIDALDEMQICNIGVYAIVDMNEVDNLLMYKKTGDPIYRTEAVAALESPQ